MERGTRAVATMRIAVAALGAAVPLASSRLESLDGAERATVSAALWSLWALALLASWVPSALSLTALRLCTPAHALVIAVSAVSRAGTSVVVAATIGLAAAISTMSSDVGNSFVQASAYGDERRVLLRCPAVHSVVQVVAGLVWFASAAVGALALANGAYPTGAVLTIVALIGALFLPSRFHRYSRRWLVAVPAGIVIHDQVVLAETSMFPRRRITGIDVTAERGESADLSGGTRGPWIRIVLDDFETVVRAPTPGDPGGTALHLRSLLVEPTRLDAGLRALDAG